MGIVHDPATGRFISTGRDSDTTKRKRWAYKAKQTPSGRAKMLYQKCKSRAREKGMEFDLTEKWIAERILRGKCESTDIPFVLDTTDKHKFAPSVDRLDNQKGYTTDNCRVVIHQLNQARNVFHDWEMLFLAYQIVRNRDRFLFALDEDDDNGEYWMLDDVEAA